MKCHVSYNVEQKALSRWAVAEYSRSSGINPGTQKCPVWQCPVTEINLDGKNFLKQLITTKQELKQ